MCVSETVDIFNLGLGSRPNLILAEKGEEDRFSYLGITSDCRISEEVSPVCGAQLSSATTSGIHTVSDIRLSISGQVYIAAVSPVQSYDSEAWPSRAKHMRRILVFEYCCLSSTGRAQGTHCEYVVGTCIAHGHRTTASLCAVFSRRLTIKKWIDVTNK